MTTCCWAASSPSPCNSSSAAQPKLQSWRDPAGSLSLTFQEAGKGSRTRGGDGQHQLVHGHAVGHRKGANLAEGHLAHEQLPEQHPEAGKMDKQMNAAAGRTRSLQLGNWIVPHLTEPCCLGSTHSFDKRARGHLAQSPAVWAPVAHGPCGPNLCSTTPRQEAVQSLLPRRAPLARFCPAVEKGVSSSPARPLPPPPLVTSLLWKRQNA